MRWTPQQLDEHLARKAGIKSPPRGNPMYALGRLPSGTMNRTETAYSEHLRLLQHAGEILWFKFEGIKLRLADNTFLTVDFAVLAKDGVLEMRECKGFMADDANVKLKVAASLYPFKFILVRRKKGGGWDEIGISH